MQMKLFAIIFLVTAVCTCSVTANCPNDQEEYMYSCKAQDEEGQDLSCTCMELKDKGKYNCTCFTNDPPPTTEVYYLDCLDALRKGQNRSGVYTLKPNNASPFNAYCDMENDGGGWTVLQRREDGSVDFYLNWADYVHGFGNASGEYWLGLSKLHRLANGSVSTQLRVDLKDKSGVEAYAKYSTFYIGGSTTDYTLHVSGYSGCAGDSLDYHNLQKFSTKDNDNDQYSGNCAHSSFGKAGWWYKQCYYSNLNGLYDHQGTGGIIWKTLKGFSYSLPFTEMKFRRVN